MTVAAYTPHNITLCLLHKRKDTPRRYRKRAGEAGRFSVSGSRQRREHTGLHSRPVYVCCCAISGSHQHARGVASSHRSCCLIEGGWNKSSDDLVWQCHEPRSLLQHHSKNGLIRRPSSARKRKKKYFRQSAHALTENDRAQNLSRENKRK